MKKLFDELIEKKAQESIKRENEQNIRKARLAELQEKNKGIKRRLLHPVNSVNDGKEIKKLKEDIAAFEKAKEDKRGMLILCGLLAFCMIMLLAISLFHKESNNEANETNSNTDDGRHIGWHIRFVQGETTFERHHHHKACRKTEAQDYAKDWRLCTNHRDALGGSYIQSGHRTQSRHNAAHR
jgi:hypothetical protein